MNWYQYIEQMSFREKLLKDQYNRIIENQKLKSNPIYLKICEKLDKDFIKGFKKPKKLNKTMKKEKKNEEWVGEWNKMWGHLANTPMARLGQRFIRYQILKARQEEREKIIKEIKEGKICLNCGGKKKGKLTLWCDKCLKEA